MTERKKKKRNTRNVKSTDQYFDYSMLAVLIFLICFGLVMLFSTSSYSALIKQGDSMFYLKRQLIFCVVGFLGMIIVSTIDYHYYIKSVSYTHLLGFNRFSKRDYAYTFLLTRCRGKSIDECNEILKGLGIEERYWLGSYAKKKISK